MEPTQIKVSKNSINSLKCYGLNCDDIYRTRIQNRSSDNTSKIVYVLNLKFDPFDKNSNQFVALTQFEYVTIS